MKDDLLETTGSLGGPRDSLQDRKTGQIEEGVAELDRNALNLLKGLEVLTSKLNPVLEFDDVMDHEGDERPALVPLASRLYEINILVRQANRMIVNLNKRIEL